ncbi:MAG TPA: dephospho-CoA kinase [Caulobacteraceae bacterium]|jgi:dephospho-CoA kinase
MIHVGLTGSIGMGKSATAAMFIEAGCPVYDADAVVHQLYAPGGAAVGPVEAAFPGVTGADGGIDRAKLSTRVVGNTEELQKLNRTVWPLMGEARREFLRKAEEAKAAIIVFDIPLLYETGGERNMDAVVVVSAPAHIQRERVLAREGMSEAKLDGILAQQMADEEKRARAHFVVDTSRGFDAARDQVAEIVATLKSPDWVSRKP